MEIDNEMIHFFKLSDKVLNSNDNFELYNLFSDICEISYYRSHLKTLYSIVRVSGSMQVAATTQLNAFYMENIDKITTFMEAAKKSYPEEFKEQASNNSFWANKINRAKSEIENASY